MVCDGYVKYEEAEVDRSAIMQDSRDNEKKTIKNHRYHCVRPYILFHIHGSAILHLWIYVNMTKLCKFKMAAERPFCNCLLPKNNQVIGLPT